jgi:late competence protein required for DNA uptake (superfamily II DNA/RNA helicase)
LATEILTETLARLVRFSESPQKLFCCRCGVTSIPRPEGATAATCYTCPSCCALLLKSRDRATADTLAAIGAQIDRAYVQEIGFPLIAGARP